MTVRRNITRSGSWGCDRRHGHDVSARVITLQKLAIEHGWMGVMTTKPVWSLAQSVDQLDGIDAEFRHPESLTIINPITGSVTRTQVITYSMPTSARDNPVDSHSAESYVPATAAEQARFAEAFELWDDLIKPQLRQ